MRDRLPFSPLTMHELNTRSADATNACGHRVRAVVKAGGTYEPHDLAYLERNARDAETYHLAAMLRIPIFLGTATPIHTTSAPAEPSPESKPAR